MTTAPTITPGFSKNHPTPRRHHDGRRRADGGVGGLPSLRARAPRECGRALSRCPQRSPSRAVVKPLCCPGLRHGLLVRPCGYRRYVRYRTVGTCWYLYQKEYCSVHGWLRLCAGNSLRYSQWLILRALDAPFKSQTITAAREGAQAQRSESFRQCVRPHRHRAVKTGMDPADPSAWHDDPREPQPEQREPPRTWRRGPRIT